MRAIDKQGKDFSEYFQKRLLGSLRLLKKAIDRYYSGDSGEEFMLSEDNLSRVLDNHFSLVDVLRTCNFDLKDYNKLGEHLMTMSQILFKEFRNRAYWDVPIDIYLENFN